MLSNRLAFAALGVACMAAAAGGGYLATRQNVVPAPASAASAPAPRSAANAAAPAPEQPPVAVQETEAVVGDRAPADAAPQAAAPSPARQTPPRANSAKADRRDIAPKPARTARIEAPAPHRAPPPLNRSWPSAAPVQPAAPPVASIPTVPPVAADAYPGAPAADAVSDPPEKTFEELVVAADSVIGLETETSISSEQARIEDRVDARVTRDVRVNDRVVIPAGTKAEGTVTTVDRGGKFKERARLGIRFNMLVLGDGTRVPLSTETIYRDGAAPNSASKVGGGAVGGAILGAILGGGKGAVLGGMAGAGAGSAVVMAGDRHAATLPAGSPLTVRILSPVTVTVEKE